MLKNIIKSNFIRRIVTASILAPVVIYMTYIGGLYFTSFLLLILAFSLFEFFNIIKFNKTVSKKKKYLWSVAGLSYISFAIFSLNCIRINFYPPYYIFVLFFSVWIFDSGAYFVGSIIGGPRILPKISPKKTWAGILGGIFFAAAVPTAYFFIEDLFPIKINQIWGNPYLLDIFSLKLLITLNFVVFGLVGQIGDLLQSFFKRKFKVKDSGNLLPGHGGILDRLDSIFLVATLLYVILYTGFAI